MPRPHKAGFRRFSAASARLVSKDGGQAFPGAEAAGPTPSGTATVTDHLETGRLEQLDRP
jgi:hypothetical protein